MIKEGFLRYSKDVERYNEISKGSNDRKRNRYNRITWFHKIIRDQIYQDHVLFKKDVSELQVTFISGYLNSL